jgi:glyoxylase-like metal-dependent hydrolase (beta-lactamase superfamily II)
VGNFDLFPSATLHLQDLEMRYATGRYMGHECFRGAYEVEDVVGMVRRVYEDRVSFHDGDEEIAPGISLHLIGGHTMGIQAVRVATRRGWLVLASDASHFYANMEQTRPFPIVWSVADMVEGYRKLRRLAESPAHIIPGHDPLVLERYRAPSKETEGIIARLD